MKVPAPPGFVEWEDFPLREEFPSGTVVSKGRFLGRNLVYFSSPSGDVGFSAYEEMVTKETVPALLTHWEEIEKLA